jgi:hypothetical protein
MHPDTLRGRHQHARWTIEVGNQARAASLLRNLITDWVRVLGHRHPYTLVSRYRLVLAVAGTGAMIEARALLDDLIADDVAVLGPDHPYTRHALALLDEFVVRGQMP